MSKEEQNKNKNEEKLTFEDKMDNVMGDVEDFFYGEKGDFNEEIPATMYNANGRRVVNKVQTRRNINNRIFGKKGKIVFLIIFGIMLLIGLLVSIFG